MSSDSTDPVQRILDLPESNKIEFKRLGAGKISKMLESICAFANTSGGLLIIGLADRKELRSGDPGSSRLWGIKENPEAFDDFQRKCLTHFSPPVTTIKVSKLPCRLRDGRPGSIALVRVERSAKVHSVVNGGTWTRGDASNRQLNASEIAELAYRRGERSAESEVVNVPLELLDTDTWRSFVAQRGLRAGTLEERLLRIGLADRSNGEIRPRRAAVLLFADEPGSLMTAFGSRADVRLMIYSGKEIGSGSTPNLKKAPETIRGPLIAQIDESVRLVLGELAQGLTLANSGFKIRHQYPERVVKEAIVNAVIHRDYRLNRDIVIRIFDDRIRVESPGMLPGNITPANIDKSRSNARNPLIAQNLREFPVPPNIDDGEGVRMMFGEMAAAHLYPPQYAEITDTAVEFVSVTLLNEERPAAWEEVSDWLDRNGLIANADVCRIASVDTLRASKMLRGWVERRLLEPVPGRGKSNAAYRKSVQQADQASLLPDLPISDDVDASVDRTI